MTPAGAIMLVAMAGGIWLWVWNALRVRPPTLMDEARQAEMDAAKAARSELHLHTLAKPERVGATSIFGLIQTKELERWNHRCAYCQTPVTQGGNLEWDHVMPLTLWGANHVSNIVPSCRECNRRKWAAHPEVWLSKLTKKPLHPITWARANEVDFTDMPSEEVTEFIDKVDSVFRYGLGLGKWVKRGRKHGRYHNKGPANYVYVYPRKVQAERDYLTEMRETAKAELALR